MRCMVIDDENLALELLRSYIDRIPFLKLSGCFTDPFEAMDHLRGNRIDLIFTDIEMNDINGVQLITSLSNRPMVIFISVYERYAIDGYTLDAIDYLLKPVSFDRFLKAVNKAYESWSGRENAQESHLRTVPALPEYLFVKTDNRLVKLFFDEILYIEGYGDYIKYHLSDGRIILSLQNMSGLDSKLSSNFVRVHRSFIVAIDKIEEIERKRIKIGKHHIPISDSYQEAFFSRLN